MNIFIIDNGVIDTFILNVFVVHIICADIFGIDDIDRIIIDLLFVGHVVYWVGLFIDSVLVSF